MEEAFKLAWRDPRDAPPAKRGMGMTALIAVLVGIAAWLVGFFTGVVPWLGHAEFDYTSGQLADNSFESTLGAPVMLLLKGQIAYFDYRTAGARGEQIYLDVKPWPGILLSPQYRTVTVGEAGRAEFPISKTGLYVFTANPTPSSYRDTVRYEVNWGAR